MMTLKTRTLTSFITNTKHSRTSSQDSSKVVQYHVYDVVNDKPFSQRTASLKGSRSKYIKVVDTYMVESEEDMMDKFESFTKMGYEGLMVRNANGLYVNKRSYDLQKVKEFHSEEFNVVGVEEGRGKLAGHGIFVCTTSDGNLFRAKMIGDLNSLKKYLDSPSLVVGRQLEVQFQGWTNGRVPRFPIGLRFRD